MGCQGDEPWMVWEPVPWLWHDGDVDLTVPAKAGCQGGSAENIRGFPAQPCSHVLCDPEQTPAPL